jgi:hypothetical protein
MCGFPARVVERLLCRWRVHLGMRGSVFGEAVAVVGGVRMKMHFFCMDLPQSMLAS